MDPLQTVATPPIAPHETWGGGRAETFQETGSNWGWSAVAAGSFCALIISLIPNGSPLVFAFCVACAVAAAVVGLVAVGIWGRPAAERAFFFVLMAGFGGMLAMRLLGTPRIGVTMQDMGGGVIVSAVEPGGTADAAGLQAPFYLAEVDGRAVTTPDDAARLIARHRVLDRVRLLVMSEGSLPRTVEVIVGP